ncbi:MAG: arginase family protein [Proteobacteria bacterium]|nr:arginase family protein [Pseudomonadota bacterium]
MKQSALDANRIALIGAPSSAGARLVGQEQAPQRLRDAGLVQLLRSDGHEVVDLGDLAQVSFAPDPQHPKQQNISLVVNVLEQVASRVEAALADGAWPLVIGGDCTVTIGVLAALTKHFPELGMIYLDGDVDLNTPDTTHTGILDGMVLAHILGRGAEELSRFGSRYPLLEEQDITLFGYSTEAGGVDPVEIELLEDTRMAKYPMEKVRDGVRDAATRALRDLEQEVDHILVHFDVVDVADFPAADVPHDPGLGLMQVREALGIFLASDKSVGLVVTEFNASRDTDGTLALRLIDLIREAKGYGDK